MTLIVCTSFLGSYLSLRGIMLLIVGYPDPFAVEKGIESNEVLFWGSVAGFVVLVGLSALYQHNSHKNGKSNGEES